ncbi:hypothetical protein DT076_15230 [Desertihabitans brevis]|uniref:Uncharacterized protein n=1 Tax=Desertihabitans brevis TaxID=2268447 RepID=A0A367YUC9_9ACTN|nr:hypothetical protein [Desertihabitans brevis]RCK68581.1 hypothetical protein DT076_15230 [Desertihabitans brevis]
MTREAQVAELVRLIRLHGGVDPTIDPQVLSTFGHLVPDSEDRGGGPSTPPGPHVPRRTTQAL